MHLPKRHLNVGSIKGASGSKAEVIQVVSCSINVYFVFNTSKVLSNWRRRRRKGRKRRKCAMLLHIVY